MLINKVSPISKAMRGATDHEGDEGDTLSYKPGCAGVKQKIEKGRNN